MAYWHKFMALYRYALMFMFL